jgi:hypothetical protein
MIQQGIYKNKKGGLFHVHGITTRTGHGTDTGEETVVYSDERGSLRNCTLGEFEDNFEIVLILREGRITPSELLRMASQKEK